MSAVYTVLSPWASSDHREKLPINPRLSGLDGKTIGLYASFGILIYSVVMDAILYGGQGEKFVYIVSEIPDGIRARILSELDIGVTDVEGVGGYTGRDKKILLVAVRKHLYPSLRDIVREEDPAAFMIVNDARAVYGEGFRSHHEDL